MQTLSAKLSKLKCSLHKEHSQSIAAVCLSENCQEPRRTLCSFCILYNHRGHQIFQLAELGNMIQEGLQEYQNNVLTYAAINIKEISNCLKLMTQKIIQLQTHFKEIKQGIKEESSIELIYKQLFINQIKKEQELESIVLQLKQLFENHQFKQPPNKNYQELFLLGKQISLSTTFFLGTQILNQKLELSQQQYQIANRCTQNIKELFRQLNSNLQADYSTICSQQDIQLQSIDASTQTNLLIQNNSQLQKPVQLDQCLQYNLGVFLNLSEHILLSNGFSKIYEKPTTFPFTEELLEKLRFDCQENTIICLGGIKNIERNKLILCAIDFAQELFIITKDSLKSRKSQNADIFWYHYKNRCFGFSKNEKISASNATADENQIQAEYRFSAWLDGDIGFRIGNNKNLKFSNEFSYVIYKKF
ncbi:unnamed protein product [Paramecium octaurelia]|uniref:Uncharacterized protein n=1 Tax=Paramecium octaurelia TaxID=43137 RepID=A0A8S1S8J3_PAROT|nr:unnamed protein product [Paramecium octaurelia]